LDLKKENFRDMEDYYECVKCPVYKRYDVTDITPLPDGLHKKYTTELVMEERTFPIFKSEPMSKEFWEYTQQQSGLLYPFKDYKDRYGKLYWLIRSIPAPESPDRPSTAHVYPHWFRGMRAAQLRIEYGLDIDQLMRWYGWESYETAQRYAGMSSKDLAVVIRRNIKERVPV